MPRLTGREVIRGFVQCPLHAGGEERTPSLHVNEDGGGWYCHACGSGGGPLEFYAALSGRDVPSGAEFVGFVRELVEAL